MTSLPTTSLTSSQTTDAKQIDVHQGTNDLVELLDKLADIAQAIKSKTSYFVLIGAIASAFLAWKFFSAESAVWWNGLKMSVLFLPILLWLILLYVLNQLQQLPELFSEMTSKQADLPELVQHLKADDKKSGLWRMVKLIRTIKSYDGIEIVFDAVSGIALIANPILAILLLLSGLFMLCLILISSLMVVF